MLLYLSLRTSYLFMLLKENSLPRKFENKKKNIFLTISFLYFKILLIINILCMKFAPNFISTHRKFIIIKKTIKNISKTHPLYCNTSSASELLSITFPQNGKNIYQCHHQEITNRSIGPLQDY